MTWHSLKNPHDDNLDVGGRERGEKGNIDNIEKFPAIQTG